MQSLFNKIYDNFADAIAGKSMDYTKGSIRKAIFMLSVPMILEMVMESFFAVVDMFFVSKVSTNAIATVGLTESVITLIYALAIGLSMAATALVARRIGEKQKEKAAEAAVQAIAVGVTVSLITGILGFIYAPNILGLMGGEADLIQEGQGYTRILFGGNITIMLLFLINAIFRGAGNASIAMRSLWLANILNMILDPILIFGFGPIPAFGIEGAAIATTTGRGIAVLYQFYLLQSGQSIITIDRKNRKLNLKVMGNLISISLGGIGQFIIGTSSWVFLMRIMSEFGSDVLAGYTISIRVIMFTILPAWGMSNAAATLVGQNLGAKQSKRAETSVWKTSKYNMYFMALVSVIYLIFAVPIVSIFSKEPEIIKYGALSLRVITSAYVFYAYGMVMAQAFNGAGDTKTPTWMNLVAFWIIQIPLAYFTALKLEWGPVGVFIAIAFSETVLAILAIYLFKKGKWKEMQV